MSEHLVRCRNAVKPYLELLEPGDTFIVAVSGGADSLALAYSLIIESKTLALNSIAVTIDHQLQRDSDIQAEKVVHQLEEMGYREVLNKKIVVTLESGLEAGARDGRYKALREIAEEKKAKQIYLGHTFNDQAETVLLGLVRGSGARSLSGMASVNHMYIRPFLTIERESIEKVCEELKIEIWNDPHNFNVDFARVKVRSEVIPYLEEKLGPGISKALVRSAAQLRDDADALDLIAEAFAAERDLSDLDCQELAELPRAIRTRVLRLAALAAGAPSPTFEQISAMEAYISAWHGQGEQSLGGGVKVRRLSGRLSLSQ
jgi:tRNA(Ile)-lysidine synthase